MAKDYINPEMQAAPVLGGTSFDPVEFARRKHAEKFQREQVRYMENEKATAEGLKNLMVDLKGWEDTNGFQELTNRNQKALDMFLAFRRKGANMLNPKTSAEIMAYKELTDYQNETKRLADVWNGTKNQYDQIAARRIADMMLPEEQRKVNWKETDPKLAEILRTHGVGDRANLLATAIVGNPQIEDVQNFINDIKTRAPKLDIKETSYLDENGQTMKNVTQIQDPAKQKQIEDFWRNQYKLSGENDK
jgi:hypothetical protein